MSLLFSLLSKSKFSQKTEKKLIDVVFLIGLQLIVKMLLSAEKRSASVLRPWWDVAYSSCLYALIGLGKKDKNNFPNSDVSHIKALDLKD
jgi:hypothetical protein